MKLPYIKPEFGQILLSETTTGGCAVEVNNPVWLECALEIPNMMGRTVFSSSSSPSCFYDADVWGYFGFCKLNGDHNVNVYNS